MFLVSFRIRSSRMSPQHNDTNFGSGHSYQPEVLFGAGLAVPLVSLLGFAAAFGLAGFAGSACAAGLSAALAPVSGLALACLTADGLAGFTSALPSLPPSAFGPVSGFRAATRDFFPCRIT